MEEKTGLKTLVLGDEHFTSSGLPAPHHLKLRMFDLVDADSIVYFDADMACLKPWKPDRFANTEAVVAVAELRARCTFTRPGIGGYRLKSTSMRVL